MSVDPRYTMQATLMGRLSKGGYFHTYAIKYEGKEIGALSVARTTRKDAERCVYVLGDQEFRDAKAFIAAHQATLK
jgi:hypothetical protein